MDKWRCFQGAFGLLLLSGCAADVVLKPAVNQFVSDSQTAATTVTKSYADLAEDANTATAMLLAAHPECGFSSSIMVRTEALNRKLRAAARRSGRKPPRLPTDTYCLLDYETAILSDPRGPYSNDPLRSTPLLILGPSEFKPQLETIHVLTDYVATLAKLADAPKLEAADEINGAADKLTSIMNDTLAIAGDFHVLEEKKITQFQALAADKGPIKSYASALAALAGSLEEIAKQEQDVRELRRILLADDNRIRDKILQIGEEADRWYAVHRRIRQSMIEHSVAGMSSELPKMSFEQRTEVFRKFLRNYAEEHASRAGSSPYGAMMVALAEAHDDLLRIGRGNYKPSEKRAMASATLQRLGGVLKGIAGVAALFV